METTAWFTIATQFKTTLKRCHYLVLIFISPGFRKSALPVFARKGVKTEDGGP